MCIICPLVSWHVYLIEWNYIKRCLWCLERLLNTFLEPWKKIWDNLFLKTVNLGDIVFLFHHIICQEWPFLGKGKWYSTTLYFVSLPVRLISQKVWFFSHAALKIQNGKHISCQFLPFKWLIFLILNPGKKSTYI